MAELIVMLLSYYNKKIEETNNTHLKEMLFT